ncbi:MAG: hypothetical protein L6461_17855 [Anaerolineae bacterium]|nr:hypothetical protein [Anaerolineae bacterium]
MSDNIQYPVPSSPATSTPSNRKALALLAWIISLILGSLSLYIYFSTSKMPSPDSAGESFAYNLAFVPVFCASLFLSVGAIIGFAFFWYFSKDFSRTSKIVLTIPIGLILSPIVLQVLFIALMIIYAMLVLLYVTIRFNISPF